MGESVKIVAVDDERVILDNIESLLQSSGFQVVKVTTATTVLDTVRNERPNLVLLDIRMPDGDGLELCKAIREDPKNEGMPIVMLTGLDEESTIVKALEYGADDYLNKPFKFDELVSKIKSLLELAKKDALPSQKAKKH